MEQILFRICSTIICGGFVAIFLVMLYWAGRHIFNGKNWEH